MKAAIIGCGESREMFRGMGDYDLVVGVNDVWRWFPVPHLVCVDSPETFTPLRLAFILNSAPSIFYTHRKEYAGKFPEIKPIGFTPGRHNFQRFTWKEMPKSNNSPFIACCVAKLLGAKTAVLYGCDFVSHRSIKGKLLESTIEGFQKLNHYYGNKLYTCSALSPLANVLPVSL